MNTIRDSLLQKIESETGLAISYEKLSPSIFRSLTLTNLVVREASSGREIARIDDVSVQFRFSDLMKGNYLEAIKQIVVKNGSVTVDLAGNTELVKKFSSLLKGDKGAVELPADGEKKNFLSSIGFDLIVRNIQIAYTDDDQSFYLNVKQGKATSGESGMRFELDSNLRYARYALELPGPASAGLQIKGLLAKDISSGSAFLTLNNIKSSAFTVSRIRLVTSWRGGMLAVNTIQELQPVDIKMLWNYTSGDLSLSLDANRLMPLRWIVFNDEYRSLAGLKDFELTGSASLKVSGKESLSYQAVFNADIPDSFHNGGKLSLNASGDQSKLSIQRLSFNGEDYQFGFVGTMDFTRTIPEGELKVQRFLLPGGRQLAGNVYITPEKHGFRCSTPVLTIGTGSFKDLSVAISNTEGVVDFDLSGFDDSGHISSQGTITRTEDGFLQSYIALDSINVANLARCFTVSGSDMKAFDDYRLTTELYASTNFTGFSFNCTRTVLASAAEGGAYLLFSANGNESGAQISEISFSGYGITASGDMNALLEKNGDILFGSSIQVNSMPYTFSGMYSSGNLSLYGDYGFALSASREDSGDIYGTLRTSGIPVPVGKALFAATVDSTFSVPREGGWKVIVSDGSIDELNGILPLDTAIQFSAEIDTSGIFLGRLTLTDKMSTISGTAYLNRILSESSDSVYSAGLSLVSPVSPETCSVEGRVTVGEDIFIDASVLFKDVPLNRFMKGQTDSAVASFSATCTGTPDNLFISADVDRIALGASDFPLEISGHLVLEDKILNVTDAGVSWNGNHFSNINSLVNFSHYSGTLDANYERLVGHSTASAKVTVAIALDEAGKVQSVTDIPALFNTFSLEARLDGLQWNKFINPEGVTVSLIREPGITALYAGKDDLVSGYLLDDGTFSLQANPGSPAEFSANGLIKNSEISVNVEGFRGDFSKVWPLLGVDLLDFPSGIISGDIIISGLLNDPDYYGHLYCTDFRLGIPQYADQIFGPFGFEIIAAGKQITAPSFIANSPDGNIQLEAEILFDRWLPSEITLKSSSFQDNPVKVNARNDYFSGSAYAYHNLVLTYDFNTISLIGSVNYDRGYFALDFANMIGNDAPQVPGVRHADKYIDLDINVGKQVEFLWPSKEIPIISGLVQADKPLKIFMDTKEKLLQVKGECKLRGGEVFYIKRSFYLREGLITFNENQDKIDPMITFKAEMRDRDESGTPVRIILSVDNQPISSFVPKFSSDPPKSETELMALLGQVASGDATSENTLRNTIVTTSDILTHLGIYRNVENSLRDVLHLDLFSVRTLVLQNALVGTSMQNQADTQMSIGNYFDNTTVYMGRYFGSAVYADALLHFSYYDPKSAQSVGNEYGRYKNLLFQPEIGLEVTTPLFLFRWGFTPTSPEALFVTDNSITLSWKFSY